MSAKSWIKSWVDPVSEIVLQPFREALPGALEFLKVFAVCVLLAGSVMLAVSYGQKAWEHWKEVDAQHALKDQVRDEQDRILSVRCVGAEVTTPACIEWARSR